MIELRFPPQLAPRLLQAEAPGHDHDLEHTAEGAPVPAIIKECEFENPFGIP